MAAIIIVHNLQRNPSGCAFLVLVDIIPQTAVESMLFLRPCEIQLLPRTAVTEAGGCGGVRFEDMILCRGSILRGLLEILRNLINP